MSSYRDDEDQLQLVKNWLREYGLVTVIAIVLAIAVVLGWQYWLRYQVGRREKASQTYQSMVALVMQDKPKKAVTEANALIQHYASTPYAVLASLWLARAQMDEGKLDAAVGHLNWALKHNKDSALSSIITLRLAKMKLAQDKTDEALALLKSLQSSEFAGVADEVRGDVYYRQKNMAAAKVAWQQALKVLPPTNSGYKEVQYKLANLPVEVSGEKK
ncbi:MAG: tetratricopeptide repeat protein [Gammaproteobacteria bacterium]|nr:tetratricopeptide repeat protein [Gammaproteobacteria bacterium]MCP4475194.1 tetratricopeptide repeat protein [Gammaproteobacteria bacterium]